MACRGAQSVQWIADWGGWMLWFTTYVLFDCSGDQHHAGPCSCWWWKEQLHFFYWKRYTFQLYAFMIWCPQMGLWIFIPQFIKYFVLKTDLFFLKHLWHSIFQMHAAAPRQSPEACKRSRWAGEASHNLQTVNAELACQDLCSQQGREQLHASGNCRKWV